MKKILLLGTILFSFSLANVNITKINNSNNTVLNQAKKELKLAIELNKLKKGPVVLKDAKIENKEIKFVYEVSISKEGFNFMKKNSDKIKMLLLNKLKLALKRIKGVKDPMLELIKKGYKVEYIYKLKNNSNNEINIEITKEDLGI